MYEDFKKHDKKESFLKKFFFSSVIKTLIVTIMLIISMIYVKYNTSNKEKFKKVVYQNTISFAKIYNLYREYIGDVIPFKNIIKNDTKMTFGDKLTYKNIKKEGNGYILEVPSSYSFGSITNGIVIEKKKDNKYGNIIKVEDKNGLIITYGYVKNTNVKLYNYVTKGQIIGECNNKLYLMIQKDNKYLSYEEYI